jgi:hypothetical protein
MICYLDAHPRAKDKSDLIDQTPILRGLHICAQVAQMAYEKGHQWHSVTSSMNHQWKRDILQSAWRKRPAKRARQERCPSCKLFYIASISWFRCKCKVAKPVSCAYCGETHNVLTFKHSQGENPDIHICRDCYECGQEPKLMEKA